MSRLCMPKSGHLATSPSSSSNAAPCCEGAATRGGDPERSRGLDGPRERLGGGCSSWPAGRRVVGKPEPDQTLFEEVVDQLMAIGVPTQPFLDGTIGLLEQIDPEEDLRGAIVAGDLRERSSLLVPSIAPPYLLVKPLWNLDPSIAQIDR